MGLGGSCWKKGRAGEWEWDFMTWLDGVIKGDNGAPRAA